MGYFHASLNISHLICLIKPFQLRNLYELFSSLNSNHLFYNYGSDLVKFDLNQTARTHTIGHAQSSHNSINPVNRM